MPDSLQARIDSIHQAKIDAIYDYIIEEKQMPQMHGNIWGIILLLIFTFITFCLFKYDRIIDEFIYNRVDDDDKVKKRNYVWAIIWLLDSCVLFGSLMFLDIIHNPKNFWFSHADVLLAIASLIAIIGAVWAIFARIDAEKAFKKSEETYKKSEQTLDAFGANYEFYKILNEDRVGGLIDKVSYNDYEISLFLGFPIIGYLYENKSVITLTEIEQKFDKLIHNIERLTVRLKIHCDGSGIEFNNEFKNKFADHKELISESPENLSLSIGVFSKAESQKILKDYYEKSQDSSIGEEQKSRIHQKLERFYNTISELEKYSSCYDAKKIKIIHKSKEENKDLYMGTNENLRFASVKDMTPGKKVYEQQRSMVWIVNDLNKNNPDFDSSVFQTSDQNLHRVLQTVFK